MIGKFANPKAEQRYVDAYAAVLRNWPIPAEELDIDTRYGPTRVRRSGTAHGTPIVLLHGIMGTSLSWYPYVADLATHPLYAVDTIGEPGHSTQTHPIRTHDDLADWLSDVLTALGHEKYHLVGISRGGFLALNLATRADDRIATVTAFEPAGFAIVGARFLIWSATEMLRWLLPQPLLRRLTPGDPSIPHTLRPLLFRGLHYRAHLPPQHLFTDDELRALPTPTHLILGERSAVHPSPTLATRVADLNPRIHTEIVPNTTHALTLQQPTLVPARILNHIQAHSENRGQTTSDRGFEWRARRDSNP